MTKDFATLKNHFELEALVEDKTKLLYHVNKLTGVYRICIPSSVAPDVLAIDHGEGHPGFT